MAAEGFLPEDKTYATRAITTRFEPLQWDSQCVVLPIVNSTTFKQESPAKPKKYIYGRSGNPTREVLQDVIAALDNAKYGLCFSSGLGAGCIICHTLKAGDHLLAMSDVYGGMYRMFNQIIPSTGIDLEFCNLTDTTILNTLIKENTKMIWIETPTNPLLMYIDIEEVCKIAHQRGIIVVVDNTFLSSYFQKPLDFGADIVHYSLTKYANGHSDVIMGALVTNDEKLYEKLQFLQNGLGIIPSPFDCYLVNRSLKTMVVRMKQHMESSYKIALFLESHHGVEKVLHPGLKSHPQRKIAQKQTSGWGGMLAIYIRGGLEESTQIIKELKLFTLAESLGGFESLIEVPSIMTHASVPLEEKIKLQLTDNLIRISIGLEDTEELIDDLKQALDSVYGSKTAKLNGYIHF